MNLLNIFQSPNENENNWDSKLGFENPSIYEHPVLGDLRPGKTQTRLLSYRELRPGKTQTSLLSYRVATG